MQAGAHVWHTKPLRVKKQLRRWLGLRRMQSRHAGLIVLLAATVAVYGPKIEVYKIASGQKLTAHIFRPAGGSVRPRPAVLLFVAAVGPPALPEWVYDAARRYASRGAVAIAGEYRLSDQKTITPLDAMADARDLVRWTRRNATGLSTGAKHCSTALRPSAANASYTFTREWGICSRANSIIRRTTSIRTQGQ